MTRHSSHIRMLIFATLLKLTSSIWAQTPPVVEVPDTVDTESAPAPSEPQSGREPARPAAPFGGILGVGRGIRIGGPNGTALGAGLGGVFGSRNGPRGDAGQETATDAQAASPELPSDIEIEVPDVNPDHLPPPGSIVLYHTAEAPEPLRLRSGEEVFDLPPGYHIKLDDERRLPIQILNADGRVIMRRALTPGTYVSREGWRGWIIARGELPAGWYQPPLPAESSARLQPLPIPQPAPAASARPVERTVLPFRQPALPEPASSGSLDDPDSLELAPPTIEIPTTPQPVTPGGQDPRYYR